MANETQIIGATLTANTDDAVRNVLKLKGTVEDLRKEFKNAQAGSDEQLAAYKKLKAAEEDLAKSSKQLAEANKGTTEHFSKIKDGINSLPGATGAAGQGVSKLSAQFKALLANPIVLIITAIVGALTLLYKAFTSTNDGADKMEQIFSGLGAAIDVIRDRVLKIAGAIAKFFSGDFSGAIKDARSAVSGLGDEIASEFKKAAEATRSLQEVEDAMRDLGVSRAKLNRDLAQTKEIITDETATLEEKKKAIEAVRLAEAKQTEQELANARKKLEAIKLKNSLSDTSDEDLQKEADAQAAIYALEEKSASDIRALNKQTRSLERQEAEKQREAEKAAIEKQKAIRQQLVEFTNKLTKLQQDNELALIKDGYEKELKQLENRIADEKRINQLSFQDKKITREQLNQLNEALDKQANIQRDAINEKHNDEVAKREAAFQKELADINTKIRLDGITNSRELEKAQLEIGYNEKLQQAMDRYKDDAVKLQAMKQALDAQLKADQDKLDAKNEEEDAKKKFEDGMKVNAGVLSDPNADFEAKRAALDAEVKLNQEAYDKKTITEAQYLENKKIFSAAAKELDKQELAAKLENAAKIGNVLEGLANLIGKQTAVGKALAVANATIQTIQSAVSSYNSMSSIPIVGPALGFVAAGLAVAAGVANVKKILAVKVPGSGGGGSVPTPAVPTAPLAPTQAATKLDADSINKINNPAAGGVNGVRAYVVEQDNAAAANRAARLSGAAVLGGG